MDQPEPKVFRNDLSVFDQQSLFTTGEAAKVLQISLLKVEDLFDSGTLDGFRVPGSRHRRIPSSSLDALLGLQVSEAINNDNYQRQLYLTFIQYTENQPEFFHGHLIGREGIFFYRQENVFTTKGAGEYIGFVQQSAIMAFKAGKLEGRLIPRSKSRRISAYSVAKEMEVRHRDFPPMSQFSLEYPGDWGDDNQVAGDHAELWYQGKMVSVRDPSNKFGLLIVDRDQLGYEMILLGQAPRVDGQLVREYEHKQRISMLAEQGLQASCQTTQDGKSALEILGKAYDKFGANFKS